MKKYKKLSVLLATIVAAGAVSASLSSCSEKTKTEDTAEESAAVEAAADTTEAAYLSTDAASATPQRGSDAEADTVITLSEGGAAVVGEGAAADGSYVTITAAGSYEITGETDDSKIIVNTEDDASVVLILNGAGIYSASSCAIEVQSAPKNVNIHLQKNSVNVITDAPTRTDGDETDAAIWSADDLKLSGSGTLYVTASYKRGIFTRDDVKIAGGTYYITAADEGIRGKESVTVSDGTLVIASGCDGIRTNETEEEGKGFVLVSGGATSITSGGDGISAATELTVTGGSISIISGGGASASTDTHADSMQGGGMFGGWSDNDTAASSSSDTVSTKGLKAEGAIAVSGGEIDIDSCDDSIHSDSGVTVSGGALAISSGDDGIHAEATLIIDGGDITVSQSYEGYEAQTISITGGNSNVTASDDGVNASGSGTPLLSITGGYLFVNASGDGLDSNGNIEISGGTAIIAGPTDNGNAPLDSGDNNNYISVTGGTLIAYGSSGMAEYPTASATTQYTFGFTLSASEGELVYVTDSDKNIIAAFNVLKSAQCVCISTPDIENGETYTVAIGGTCTGDAVNGVYSGGSCEGGSESCQLTVSSPVTTYGSAGGMGGMGGMGGSRPGGMNRW